MNRVFEALERLAIQDNEEYKDATSVLELVKRDKAIVRNELDKLNKIDKILSSDERDFTKLSKISEVLHE
jgi:hypothetical protein